MSDTPSRPGPGPPASGPGDAASRYAELEELERGLAAHGRDIVTLADGDGVIVHASANLPRILGYTPEERRGGTLFDLLHPEERARVRDAFLGAVRAERPFDLVVRVREKSGGWRWLEASGRPFRTPTGELRCVVVSRDATERMAEERLRRGETEVLHGLVGGRPPGEVLCHIVETLYQAGAEQPASILLLDESGRRLRVAAAAGLPVRHLHALDELTLGPGASPSAHAVRGASTLWVEDIERDPRCAGPFRERARALGLRACGAAPILAGSSQPRGVLNLYRPRPGSPTPHEQRLLETGARLASLALVREQLEHERTRRFLEDYQRLFEEVAGHARDILARLPEGHPARPSADAVARAASRALDLRGQLERIEPRPAAPAPAAGAAPARILVVDDDEGIRQLLYWVLRRSGYEVTLAADGREALERFEREGGSFDLVVLDWAMPGVDGREAFQALRARRPGLPVLFATGHAGEIAREPEARAPGTDILAKPFEPQALVDRVAALLGR